MGDLAVLTLDTAGPRRVRRWLAFVSAPPASLSAGPDLVLSRIDSIYMAPTRPLSGPIRSASRHRTAA